MIFYMPTKVYQERECVVNHSKEMAGYGKKALIVTGKRSSKENGSLDDVITALEKENVRYEVYDDVEENPSIETVMKARDYGLAKKAEFVVGVGGGSPLDAAKAIALMIANPDEGQELLYDKRIVRALPVIAVPTTCGTGSETTPYAILTIHEKRTKCSISHQIFPEVALIDGKYIQNTSLTIIASTAIDALGHLIESYLNAQATPFHKMLCEYGFSIWEKSKEVLIGERRPENEDYDNLLLASAIAGMAIAHTGTSLPHGMSYKLTYEMGVSHGIAVGVFIASYMEAADRESAKIILEKIGIESIHKLRQYIDKAIGKIEVEQSFMKEAIAEMMSNKRKLANCPYEVSEGLLEKIYRESVHIK